MVSQELKYKTLPSFRNCLNFQRIKDNEISVQNNLASKTSQPIYKHKLSGCCYETRLLIVVRGAKAIKIFQILVIDPKLVFRF